MNMLLAVNRAFGVRAVEWAARFAAPVPLLTSDRPNVAEAFFEAARRRKAARRFAASVFLEDRRAHTALYIAAPPILAQLTDYDERAGLLDAVARGEVTVGGRPQAEIERHDPHDLRRVKDFLLTADLAVMRSSVERERVAALLGRRFAHTVEIAPLDPRVPAPSDRPAERAAIVIWAPQHPAEACGIFAFALEESTRPAIVVCAGGQPARMRPQTRYVTAADGAAALAQAAVIVDASLDDPGTARALARWGVPIAVAASSGAADWLDGVPVYDPWNHASIHAAVANALGARAASERRDAGDPDAALGRALLAATPPPPASGPLVSVIVPTVNERASLRDAIASIAAQTYPNVELVLVNDGGAPIDPAILGAVDYTLLELPERRGVANALNTGLAAARGAYISLLADDDAFCPDHIALLAGALERTGAHVAQSIELREYAEPDGAGGLALNHYSLMIDEPARKTILQSQNVIGASATMVSKAAYERVGAFDADAGFVLDFEMWLRLSERFDFIHVDRVTTIMAMRTDGSQLSATHGAAAAACFRHVYARHPTNRPKIVRDRGDVLRAVEQSGP
jgi:hypothetical protein